MKAIRRFLGFLAAGWPTRILAALLLSAVGSIVYVMALISVIGIPVALALQFLPAAAALYIGAELIHQVSRLMLPAKPVPRWVVAASLACAAVVLGQVANMRIAASARSLVAQDLEAPSLAPVAKLALSVDRLNNNPASRACNQVCLRLLIGGTAKEVVLTGPVDPALGPQAGAPAIAAKFVRMGECPRKHFFPEPPKRAQREGGNLRVDYAAYAEARRRQEAGDCLVETNTTLGAADTVVAVMKVKNGVSAAGAGLDPWADTVSAKRVSLFRREGGQFVERARKTAVRKLVMPVAAAPTYVFSSGLNVELALGRWSSYLNADGRLYSNYDGELQAAFLQDDMGLNLDPSPASGD